MVFKYFNVVLRQWHSATVFKHDLISRHPQSEHSLVDKLSECCIVNAVQKHSWRALYYNRIDLIVCRLQVVTHQHHALTRIWTIQRVVRENSQTELFIRFSDPRMCIWADIHFDRCRSDKFVVRVLVHCNNNRTSFCCENVVKSNHEVKPIVVSKRYTLCRFQQTYSWIDLCGLIRNARQCAGRYKNQYTDPHHHRHQSSCHWVVLLHPFEIKLYRLTEVIAFQVLLMLSLEKWFFRNGLLRALFFLLSLRLLLPHLINYHLSLRDAFSMLFYSLFLSSSNPLRKLSMLSFNTWRF